MQRNPFNSMEYGKKDGAELGVMTGEYVGRAVLIPLRPRTLQLHRPGGNVLLTRCTDPISGEPNFKAFAGAAKISD